MQPKIVLNSLLLLLLLPFICPYVNGTPTPIEGHKNHSNQGKMVNDTAVNGTAMRVKRPENKNLLQLGASANCNLVLGKGNWTVQNLLNIYNPITKPKGGYGCYCGPGHRGEVPVDAIDMCCQMHDACYHDYNVKWRAQCAHPYFETYVALMCNATQGYETKCLVDKNKPCQEFLCECDKTVVECLLKQPGPTEMKGCPEANFTHWCKAFNIRHLALLFVLSIPFA